jgi:hypothetical protein
MKFFKFLQGSLFAFAFIALMGISQEARAQYNLTKVTVSVNPQEFQAAYAYGVIPVKQLSQLQYIGNGPGGGVAPWPPISNEPPCPDATGMTAALAQYLTNMANQYCHDVYYCVQEKDCGWYLYVFRPTSPNCIFPVQYQAVLQAYSQ